MVILEQIKSNVYLSVAGVIQEAMKIGNLKNLDEAVIDNQGAVVVAKVRDILTTVKADPELRLPNVRHLLLKEVYKDGRYGNKFKAVLFGGVVLDTEVADLCIGDRLIFVQPSVVLMSMYDTPAEIYPYQLECGLPAHKNQRLILIKKKFSCDNVSNESKQIEPNGKLRNDEKLTVSIQPFTTSFTEKHIVGSNLKVGKSVINHYTSKKVSNKFKYVYKKVADIKEAESKVNMYVVVSELLKVQTAQGTRKHNVSFKGIDETCADNEHLVIYTLFDETDMNYDLIKPSMVLRLHRMQVNQYNNFLEGKVFKGSDILIFVPTKNNGCTITTCAKSFTFTNEDTVRVVELQKWLKTVNLPSLTCHEVEWQTLNSIRPEGTFQLHCRIDGVTMHPLLNILVLHVSDGLYCPLRLYQVPVKEEHWSEESHHFKTNLRTVDVIVEYPSEQIMKLKKGTFIVLGPIKLNQCEVDTSGPNSYKMELQQNESIKILKSPDPVITKIEKRFADDPINNYMNNLQDQETKLVSSEMPANKNTQKEGVFKEKRKLFNVNDNFDHSEAKKKKNKPSISSEIVDNTKLEKQNQPLKDVRIKSPLEDDIFFNWTKSVPSDVYAEQSNGGQISLKSSDANPSKQTLNLKRKISANRYLKLAEVSVNPQIPVEETGQSEKSDKNFLMSELKTKRIDTMSQASVDKYFEELGTMLTKYVTPRNKSSSPGSEVDKNAKPKSVINQVEVYPVSSSPSSSSVIVLDEDKESEDKALNQPSDKPALDEDNKQEKTLVLKLVQLPPGQKSRVVVQDNVVHVEMDHKGRVDDAEHITLLSLFEGKLGKKITTIQNGDNTSPASEKDKDSPRKDLNKTFKSKIFGTETKLQNVDISVTDQFILNKLKIKKSPSEKISNIPKTTVKKTKNKRSLNLLNNNHQKIRLDSVDLCDANTVINEKVKEKKSVEVVSVPSTAASTIKNQCTTSIDNVLRHEECASSLKSLYSVKDWLEHTDFSPPSVIDQVIDDQHAFNDGSPRVFNSPKTDEDLLNPFVGLSKIKVFLMDVQPLFRDDPMDLASGYCSSGCHKLYLFSTLIYEYETKSALCPECYSNGEKKAVKLMFALQLTVMDQEGYQFTALLFREHAEQLLGCTIRQYVHHKTTRKKVINFFSTLKYDINKSFTPMMTMCTTPIDSQVIALNTKIIYQKKSNKP